MKVVQLLGLQGPWWHQVCRDMDCLCPKSHGPISLFRASCSWRSECLFGQSFSIAPPIQALRGLCCLGSFSVAQQVRHIEGAPRILLCRSAHQALKGAPWVGSCSVIQCLKHLMGQPLLFSCRCRRVWREAMMMAPPPMRDSAVLPCFHGSLAFLHRHFPP